MLVLSRRLHERIQFPGLDISIQVVAIQSGVIRLGIEAPPDVSVLREELLQGAACACLPPGGHNGRKRQIRGNAMQVLTKRASEEVVLAKPARIVVLETTADEVKFGILDDSEGPGGSCRETSAGTGGHTGAGVRFLAPDGEEVEVDS
jgi:carbon storage regulator CsrA